MADPKDAFETSADVDLIDDFIEQEGGDRNAVQGLQAHDYDDEAPLSAEQRRLWFLQKLEPESVAYHVPLAVRLKGAVEAEALRGAFREMVRRHEILRTVLVEEEGGPKQRILEDPPLDWRFEEVSGGDEEYRKRLRDEIAEPFDLAEETPLRVRLWRENEDEYVLLALFHHVAIDEWATGVVLGELEELYEASVQEREPRPEEMEIQYADYALWQDQRMESEKFDEGLSFWEEHLAGAQEGIDWPMGQEPTGEVHPAERVEFEWGEETSELVREMADRQGVSEFVVLYALFGAFLGRYTGQWDVTIGLPVTRRERPELQALVGFLLNTIPMRAQVRMEAAFEDWIAEVAGEWRESRPHHWIPLEEIVEAVRAERPAGQLPLFDVMFTYLPVGHGEGQGRGEFADLRMELEEFGGIPEAKCALNVAIGAGGRGYEGGFEFDASRFERSDIEQMVGAFERFVESCLHRPGVSLAAHELFEAPKRRVFEEWARGLKIEVPSEPIHRRFEERVDEDPDRVALRFKGGEWTYGELNVRANRLAHRLRELGVGPDVPVGVSVERSPELIAALLGVMKAGGGYVPLQPDLPGERLAYMTDDAGVEVLVFDEAGRESRDWEVDRRVDIETATTEGDGANLEVEVFEEHLAYILYTSGTTGRPKGVAMSHGALENHTAWMQRAHPLESDDVIYQKTPYGFDASVWEIWSPLAHGAGLYLAMSGAEQDPSKFLRGLERSGATVLQATPTQFSMILDDDVESARTEQLRLAFSGGEALTATLRDAIRDRFGVDVVNLYGPTEACIDSTWYETGKEDREVVPIGGPIANVETYVVDQAANLVGEGVRGELAISGRGLARGYWGRARMTARSFVPAECASASGARMYESGDLVNWGGEGVLEYEGRRDDQMQVRGMRVEIGEIEAYLEEAPGVVQAAVRAVAAESGRAESLVGYVVAREGAELEPSQLREHLSGHLQAAVVPGRYVELEEMPRTPSGKIDRSGLPEPDDSMRASERVEPRTETEQRIADIWCEHLGLDEVGVHENFFEIGGHSLLAVRIQGELSEEFGLNLPLRDLVEHPTIDGVATYLTERELEGVDDGDLDEILADAGIEG